MRPEEFFLRDILFACERANRFVKDISWEFFETSDLYQSAVQYQLMVIGEAVTKVSRRTKSRHADIDWQSIAGFRHILVHEYFALDIDIIWDSANNDVVMLCEAIKALLSTEYPDFPLPDVHL